MHLGLVSQSRLDPPALHGADGFFNAPVPSTKLGHRMHSAPALCSAGSGLWVPSIVRVHSSLFFLFEGLRFIPPGQSPQLLNRGVTVGLRVLNADTPVWCQYSVIVGTPISLCLLSLSFAAHPADWSLGLSDSYINLCIQSKSGFSQLQPF